MDAALMLQVKHFDRGRDRAGISIAAARTSSTIKTGSVRSH
jgi:hypothetical protein